jgi:tetratricopeptide (TPR) repeat protein
LIAAMVAPVEAQRRGGGGRRGNRAPTPVPATDAPAETPGEAPPPAEPARGPGMAPLSKVAAMVALQPHLLAYQIGPARDALGRVGDRQSAGALVAEGRVLTLEARYSDAVERFDRAAAAAPDDPAPLVHKGEALLYARQDGPAKQALGAGKARAQARVDAGGDAESLLYLGMAQRHLGELDAAYASLDRARALAPGDERILFEMGATRYVQQRWQPAIDLLNQTLDVNPRVAYAYYLRGMAASQADQKDLMVNDLGRFVELAPTAPEAERARKVLASIR